MNKFLSCLPVSLVLIIAGCRSDEPAIIQKHLNFIGGEKRWSEVTTVVSAGEYDYGGLKFPFSTIAKAPSSYKFVVPFEGKFYAQGYDGRKGWKIDAFKNETKPKLLDSLSGRELANESDVAISSPWIRYKADGFKIVGATDTAIRRIPTIKIRLESKVGSPEFYYFDTNTGALTQKIARSKNTELNGSWLTTTFSDYRTVDGLKFPFLIEHEANGQKILIITVKSIAINQPINDSEFQP